MPSSSRLDRLRRFRARLRERAAAVLAGRAATLATIDHALAATRAAEDEARTLPTAGPESGATLVLAWAYADALARRASGLLDDRARAITSAEGARETLRDRHREEEQLARLAARIEARDAAGTIRARDRALDELTLWTHGRKG
jgi:flagellar export protein FliJ